MQKAKNYCLLLILLCTNIGHSFAQDDIKKDSLLQVISNSNSSNDSKANALLGMLDIYMTINYDTALYYGKEALELTIDKNDTLAIEAYRELGFLSYMSNKYDDLYKYISSGIDLSLEKDIDKYLMDLYNLNGSALQEQGLLNQSMENFLKSRELATTKQDTYGLVRVIVNLSIVYYRIKDYDKVFENSKEAIKIAKKQNYNNVLFYAYNMLGGAYETVKKHDESLKYYRKAYHISDSLNEPIQKATALANIASEESRRGNFNDAIKSYTTAKDIYEGLNDQHGKYEVIGSLGELQLNKKNYREALKLCKESYNFSKENSILYEQEVNCECMYKAHKNLGNHEKALFFHEKHKILSDSVFSTERKSELTNIELTYKFDQEKDRLKLEQKEKEIILENKNSFNQFLALLFSLLTITSISSFLWIRRKNQLIKKQKEELEEINTTKDKLFAIIGHDLKRPAMALKGISTKVKYLLDNKEYERLNQFGNQIEENANSFNAIVNNLLHWALLQKDVMPYKPQVISLKEIVNHVVKIYKTEAQSKNIKIEENISKELKVYTDEVALSAVLSNLIDNAIKFTDENGVVRIEGEKNGSKTKVSIQDTGKGLSPSQLKKLFSLVKNKTNIGTKGELGTGLGLHLVYELVKLNKGDINVKSELHKGTSFDIIFPSKVA